ncbi:hypothetical protein PLESTB_001377200 [Pleodorina starrii]|uniref:Lon N-terminal domain-containing protein n=1 Tax=Pleodorina starrii TaxID=330485 RepID=A0A9W6BUS8_9CHLO|nr:hypothetical protein PLESTB_001377200 [Pleodorina starrii]
MGWAVSQLLGSQKPRRLQTASTSLSEHEGLASGADPSSAPSPAVGTTQLHSVLSAQDGPNSFAVATVTFAPPAEDAGATATASIAQHAAQVALLAVRGALGSQRPPSALVALPSLDLPRPAVQALAEALAGQLGPDTPLLGCSSRQRLPDERRAAAAAAAAAAVPPAAAAVGGGEAGSASPTPSAFAAAGESSSSSSPSSRPPLLHVTLAAAHLPYHEARAIRCETSSLPRLPYLAEALQGRRPPAFLLLAGADSLAVELLTRLENLFPGSCIGTGVAARQLGGRDRRLVLVGPGGAAAAAAAAGGGGGSRTAGGGGAAAAAAAAQAESYGIGRSGDDTTTTAAAAAAGAIPSSSSEFEGHFQRMLLDRDGSATASTSSSSGSGNNSGVTSRGSGGAGGGGGGRRRRLPGAAAGRRSAAGEAAAPPRTSQAAAAVAGDDDSDDDDEDGAAEAEALAAVLDGVKPPYLILGDQVHGGGGALLAVYPKEATTAAAAPPPPPPAVGRRLDASSSDSLARLVLGTDQLHHVALWGSTLASISPPPTGPEPATAFPPAPDNPFYWWPAAVQLPPSLTTDPHSALSHLQHTISGTGRHPTTTTTTTSTATSMDGLGATAAAEGRNGMEGRRDALLAAPPAAAAAAAEKEEGEGEKKVEEGREEEGEEDSEDGEAAAALAALSSDLTGLPLFPLQGVILFPGQTIQLRVFEKRYRLLARSCLQQGAAFGLCWRGMGTTAVVRSYQAAEEGGAGDVMVLLEGGVRFSYEPDDLGVLPATYGLNVAGRAEYVVDEPPGGDQDAAALLATAHSVLDGIAGALEEAVAPSVQQAARTFANALHFASSSGSSSQQPAPAPAAAAAAAPGPASGLAATPATAAAATSPSPSSPTPSQPHQQQQPHPQPQSQSQSQQQPQPQPESDAALLAADLAEAKLAMDAETASLLSLYLAPHIPVHLESLRREWHTSRSALWRLQQEAAWLRSSPRVAMATAASVLRLPREHPLRLMLGLSRVAPVGAA